MNNDDSPGGQQLVPLEVYNSSYDPDNCESAPSNPDEICLLLPEEDRTDILFNEWFDVDGNLVNPIQSLPPDDCFICFKVTRFLWGLI